LDRPQLLHSETHGLLKKLIIEGIIHGVALPLPLSLRERKEIGLWLRDATTGLTRI
jgi:hypothetical protein